MNHAEDKVDIKEQFSPEAITPAAQEERADDGEDMINDALVHSELRHRVLNIGIVEVMVDQIITQLLSKIIIIQTCFI